VPGNYLRKYEQWLSGTSHFNTLEPTKSVDFFKVICFCYICIYNYRFPLKWCVRMCVCAHTCAHAFILHIRNWSYKFVQIFSCSFTNTCKTQLLIKIVCIRMCSHTPGLVRKCGHFDLFFMVMTIYWLRLQCPAVQHKQPKETIVNII
jgi:hypothetical protein